MFASEPNMKYSHSIIDFTNELDCCIAGVLDQWIATFLMFQHSGIMHWPHALLSASAALLLPLQPSPLLLPLLLWPARPAFWRLRPVRILRNERFRCCVRRPWIRICRSCTDIPSGTQLCTNH